MDIYFSTPWHFISLMFVLLFGSVFALTIRHYFFCGIGRTLLLYCWHALFSIVYAIYVVNNGGDAMGYYRHSLAPDIELALGTRAVEVFTSFLTQGLGLSLLGCFFVFNIFGFIGFLAFDASLRSIVADKSKNIRLLATLIVFLPSVSFWSAGLGKDAISFMAVGLALWASLDLSKRTILMFFSVLLMLVVRPHMAGLMIMGLAASFVLQKGMPLLQRLILGFISLGVVAILVPFALNYAGVGENVDADKLGAYIDERQGYNQEGGGGVDISSMSLPMQLFTYMFRPLPFEAHSIASLMASLDNMILLYLFVVGSYFLIKTKLTPDLKLHNRVFMWYYLCGSWIVLSLTTANLGIAVRQKWMIAPMLIFLFLSVIRDKKENNYEN